MPTGYKDIGERQQGDPNIMKLKDVNKVRPLDNQVAGWRQHGIEHPSDPEQFASVVCPGARSCPLCRKPVDAKGDNRFPISRRFAANVFDYDTASVKVLVGGPSIFDEFKAAAKVGIDPAQCDWTITKTGQGINTKYEVIRHDASPFSGTITPDMLHDVAKYEMPSSTEAIFEMLEKYGIDYDSLEVPSYTYEQALAFVMPYTKHRGLTIEQLVTSEPDYADWMYNTKLEQGQLGDPVFLALQTVLQERGEVLPLEEALSLLPEPEAPPAPEARVTAPMDESLPGAKANPTAVSEAGMVRLIGPDGGDVVVPSLAVDAMLRQGFKLPKEPPATAADASAPTEVLIGGKKVVLPREQALMLIDAGTAQRLEPEAPEQPMLPLPDESVRLSVGGTVVEMPYVQAAQLVNAGSGSFEDEAVASAHTRSKESEAAKRAAAPSGSPEPPSASTASKDPEKPFECDQCSAAYKTQGALTTHRNKVHGGASQQPHPAAHPNGSESGLRDRVKSKIQRLPFANDYQEMLGVFESTTGERNFMQMNDEQLATLEVKLDELAAEAALQS